MKKWLNTVLSGKEKEPVIDPWSITADPLALPLEWDQREKIKETYTNGREFFIFAGDIHPRHQLLVLLKAFSHFKKWQRSEMKLIIAGTPTKWTEEFREKLLLYKYKEDVLVMENPDPSVLIQLIAAAYALVYLTNEYDLSAGILNAIQARVPVIASDTAIIREITGNSLIFVPAGDQEELARNLLLLYKDEAFRTSVIQKAALAPGPPGPGGPKIPPEGQ